MLGGMQKDPGESMLKLIAPDITPDAENMEMEMNRALYNKTAKFKEFNVKTYDLGDTKQSKAYTKTMKEMYAGIQATTHALLYNDRQFITEGGKPRWVVHIEWVVFELTVTANPSTAGAPAQGDTDGK